MEAGSPAGGWTPGVTCGGPEQATKLEVGTRGRASGTCGRVHHQHLLNAVRRVSETGMKDDTEGLAYAAAGLR